MKKFLINAIPAIIAAVVLSGLIYFALPACGSTIDLDDYEECDITVYSGDTLWEYAEQYAQDGDDLRDWIYEVRQLNNLSSSDNIKAGEIITVLIKK